MVGARSGCGGEALGVFPIGRLVAEAFDRVEVADNNSRGGGLADAFFSGGGDERDGDGGESLRVGGETVVEPRRVVDVAALYRLDAEQRCSLLCGRVRGAVDPR